jgi:D-psicose/D-tagatose/L-ribulose 3-epimerase
MKLALMVGAPDMTPGGYVEAPTGAYAATLNRAAHLGFDGVEVMAAERSATDLSELRQALAATRLGLAGINSGRLFSDFGLALLCGDSQQCGLTRSAIYGLIRLAAPFGAHINIGMFRGRPASGDDGPALGRLVGILREMGEYAHRLGVGLLLEPQNRKEFPFVVGTAEGLALVRRVDHPSVGLMLDTFHMVMEGEDPCISIERALPYLRHIHLLDMQRSLPQQAAAPGFDLAALMRTLAKLNYRHYLSVPLARGADDETTARAARELRALAAA